MRTDLLQDDRRVLLARLLGDDEVGPMPPEARGGDLLAHILLPGVRNVYAVAARPWPEDAEALVHGVRVASRRLVEALALIAPATDAAQVKRAQRRAKALRQALGASREADVLVADFRALATRAGLDEETVHALDRMTAHGQEALQSAKDDYPPERLLAHGVDALRLAATSDSELELRALAGPHLYARVEAAAPLVDALHDRSQVPAHHRLRIRIKHLRYTAELLAAPFSEVFDADASIAELKALQDALGVLNDAQDLLHWLERKALRQALGKKTSKIVRGLVAELVEARYEQAKALVLERAPGRFGDLRRAAGLIGPIDA